MLAHRGGAGSSQDDDGLMTVQKNASIVGNLVVFAPKNVAAVGILKFPCGEDEHVVSGACVRCPSAQFNQAGDLPGGPDTACDAECTCARLLNKVGLSYV